MALKHRGILRLGHVRVSIEDFDSARSFAIGSLGLIEHRCGVDDDGVERSYLRTWRDPLAYDYVIERGEPRLVEVGFQVRDDADLDSVAQRVRGAGIDVDVDGEGQVLADLGPSISFVVPAGPRLRLFADIAVTGPAPGWKAPHWNIPKVLRGTAAPMNLGHVGFASPDPDAAVTFLSGVLDFGISETISSDDGDRLLSALLFRSNYGQDLAVFPGSRTGLHHVAFLQYDESAVVRDAAWLLEDGARIDAWGPTRQSYGRTMSLHFEDPSGVRLELFAGGRFSELHPEFRPVRWTESNLAKALSFYDRTDNAQFLEPSL